jgi:hypothetical protein
VKMDTALWKSPLQPINQPTQTSQCDWHKKSDQEWMRLLEIQKQPCT